MNQGMATGMVGLGTGTVAPPSAPTTFDTAVMSLIPAFGAIYMTAPLNINTCAAGAYVAT